MVIEHKAALNEEFCDRRNYLETLSQLQMLWNSTARHICCDSWYTLTAEQRKKAGRFQFSSPWRGSPLFIRRSVPLLILSFLAHSQKIRFAGSEQTSTGSYAWPIDTVKVGDESSKTSPDHSECYVSGVSPLSRRSYVPLINDGQHFGFQTTRRRPSHRHVDIYPMIRLISIKRTDEMKWNETIHRSVRSPLQTVSPSPSHQKAHSKPVQNEASSRSQTCTKAPTQSPLQDAISWRRPSR